MFRVKVYGPSASSTYGADIHEVESPDSVDATDTGALTIITPGSPERPHPYQEGKSTPAIRSREVIYPQGGWTKVVIEDVVK